MGNTQHNARHAEGHHHQEESGAHTHGAVGNFKVAFLLNATFTVIEVVGGILTNSLAILSDALHDLGDTLSLGLSWYLEHVAARKRSATHSYGYRRYSLLSALVNAIVLFGGAIIIIVEAVPRLLHPEQVHPIGMLVLAILGIVVNGLAVLRLRGGEKINQKMVMLHFLEDVLGWVAVLAGSIVLMLANIPSIDTILSLAITIVILGMVFRRLIRTMKIFLQAVPPDVDLDAIEAFISDFPDVKDVHDIHAWSMDGEYNILTVHVVVPDNCTSDRVMRLKTAIRDGMHEHNIEHVTIEVGRESEDCGLRGC